MPCGRGGGRCQNFRSGGDGYGWRPGEVLAVSSQNTPPAGDGGVPPLAGASPVGPNLEPARASPSPQTAGTPAPAVASSSTSSAAPERMVLGAGEPEPPITGRPDGFAAALAEPKRFSPRS